LLWGLWNGLTAWIVLIVHVFGGWEQFPFYNAARSGNWYDLGFLLGAGSPFWALPAAEGGKAGDAVMPTDHREEAPCCP